MTSKSNLPSIVIALCCVVVTGLAVKREFAPPNRPTPVSLGPELVKDWERYKEHGNRVGSSSAPVTIVEFSDFECPFCRRLHETLREIRAEYPQIATVYRHYPLERIHQNARKAALASECAASLGRFTEFADALFERQDSIGVISWAKFGQAAGISDTLAFNNCIRDSVHVDRIRVDQEAGKALKVTGTPTVLVNQWRIRGGAKESIIKLIEDALKGR
jgi:protein-disulfide isomerase